MVAHRCAARGASVFFILWWRSLSHALLLETTTKSSGPVNLSRLHYAPFRWVRLPHTGAHDWVSIQAHTLRTWPQSSALSHARPHHSISLRSASFASPAPEFYGNISPHKQRWPRAGVASRARRVPIVWLIFYCIGTLDPTPARARWRLMGSNDGSVRCSTESLLQLGSSNLKFRCLLHLDPSLLWLSRVTQIVVWVCSPSHKNVLSWRAMSF